MTMPAYAPINNAELSGHVEVKPFKYALKEKIDPYTLKNTAIGNIKLTEPVADVVTNGVRRELRQAGLSVKPGANCWMDGDIRELMFDDLGYSIDYISDIRYVLHSGTDEVLMDKAYQRKFTTDKLVDGSAVLLSLNRLVGENLSQMIEAPEFQKVIEERCGS